MPEDIYNPIGQPAKLKGPDFVTRQRLATLLAEHRRERHIRDEG
jgi:hypothetical protein